MHTLRTASFAPMTRRPTRLLYAHDPRSSVHQAPGYHPERPERLAAAKRGLDAVACEKVPLVDRVASASDLLTVHGEAFVERMLSGASEDEGATFLDPDTYMVQGSLLAAQLAAGAGLEAVDAILRGDANQAAVLVRPPGHHARRDQAMGFCLFNNAALMAEHARRSGCERVAIVDFDVHHGNGTQEIFYDRPDVLYVSTHQHPFYPGTGAAEERGQGDGTGFTVNVPLSGGGEDSVYESAFSRVVLPVLAEYKPDFVIVSAGFDAALRDPLAEMRLSDHAYRFMMRELVRVASASAKGRLAMLLEGGYDLPSLESGVRAALEGMLEIPEAEPHVVSDAPASERDVSIAEAAARKSWYLG